MSIVLAKPQTWSRFHERWAGLKPPLRPNHEVVKAFAQQLSEHKEQVLLLGVTPELSALGTFTTALERHREMIDFVWPGDNDSRKAVQGNWLSPEFPPQQFSAIIGDGILSCLPYSTYPLFFEQMRPILQTDGVMLIRLYLSPDQGQSLEQLRSDTLARKNKHFHAFKWQLGMALMYETGRPDVPVATIHQVFERTFPDRSVLSKATGWSLDEIAEIDAYDKADYVFSFPTLAQLLSVVPVGWETEIIPVGKYPLAERCPMLRIVPK